MIRLPNGFIDFAAWTGDWPFLRLRYKKLEELRGKLESLGVIRAFVSPIEAILLQDDPLKTNIRLFEAIQDPFFSPVPIVDLSYTNWEMNIEAAVLDGRVRMVKLLPNYHRYLLTEKLMEKLVQLTVQHRLLISVQMRMEDMRGQYPLMKVPDVEIVQTVKTLSHFPQQPFVLNYVYTREAVEAVVSCRHLYVDLAGLEHIDIVQWLSVLGGSGQVLFSTHSPFFVPEAAIYKLSFTDAEESDVEQIAYGNAQRLLDFGNDSLT